MKNIHILLVEDNEGDIVLTREGLQDAGISMTLSVVRDGKEAIDFVSRQGKYSESACTDLLLLDVNLPKKNGHEVLQFIKSDILLRHIPVIMLTTSSSERDINFSYNHYVNCYITKPVDVHDFLAAITFIARFWILIAALPTGKKYVL